MRSRALSGGTVVFIKHYPHERKQRRKRRGFVRIVLESRGRGKRRGAGVRKRGQGYGETWNVAVSQPFFVERKRKEYVRTKGMAVIKQHAAEIVRKRLAPAEIRNDGKQTPMRHGLHPVFIAQHATACCCRGCFEKWHGIPKGVRLSQSEQGYAVSLITEWIRRQTEENP